MAEQKSKNDTAWEELFAQYNILSEIEANGLYRISASTINQKREARLMTKFDHLINLPQIFAHNKLAILPDSRSSYVIGRFECYAQLPQDNDTPISEKSFPAWIQSLSSSDLYSESAVLLCAQHAELFAEVLEEEVAFTVFGRMSTGKFDFLIRTSHQDTLTKQLLSVDRAQCEIDGGFEGAESFVIVEVKNEAVSDFHIRQLYYPYRLWNNRLNKRIIPVFLTYSNEIFTFSVYEFEQPNEYNSLQLKRRKRYQIVPTEIEISDIRASLTQARVVAEPKNVPFPQADRFERVIDLLSRLQATGGTLSQEEITLNYAFDIRQTQYYTNAGRYLGLVERAEEAERGVFYTLTTVGTQLMTKPPRARNQALITLILSHSVFRSAIEYWLANARPPSREEVVGMMRSAELALNQTTGNRRAQTVLGWVRWVIGLTSEG